MHSRVSSRYSRLSLSLFLSQASKYRGRFGINARACPAYSDDRIQSGRASRTGIHRFTRRFLETKGTRPSHSRNPRTTTDPLSISGGDRSNSQSRMVRRTRGGSRSRLHPIKSRRLSVRDPAWFTFSERKPARFYSRTKRADLLLFPRPRPRRRRRRCRHTRCCKPKLHY